MKLFKPSSSSQARPVPQSSGGSSEETIPNSEGGSMNANMIVPVSTPKSRSSTESLISNEDQSPPLPPSSNRRSTLSETLSNWMHLGPHKFLEVAPDAVLLVDPDGIIRFANHMVVQTLGYSRAELVGQPVHILVPDDRRPKHSDFIAGWFRNPRTRPMGADLSIEGRNKNGDLMKLDIHLSPIETDIGVWAMAWIKERVG